MSYDTIQFTIAQQAQALGLTGVGFAMRNLNNQAVTPAKLASLIDRSVQAVMTAWEQRQLEADPIIADFRRLHRDVGAGLNDIASPEGLVNMVRKKGRLPKI